MVIISSSAGCCNFNIPIVASFQRAGVIPSQDQSPNCWVGYFVIRIIHKNLGFIPITSGECGGRVSGSSCALDKRLQVK